MNPINKVLPPATIIAYHNQIESLEDAFQSWWADAEKFGKGVIPTDEKALIVLKSMCFSAMLTGCDLTLSVSAKKMNAMLEDVIEYESTN